MQKSITEKEAMKILKKYSIGEKFFGHCVAVSKKATEIAKKIKKNGYDVDVELVKTAGLLHDIGKFYKRDMGHGKDTGRILRGIGCCEKMANAAEMHDTPVHFSKISLEAKIIRYADSITLDSRCVGLEKRFENTIRRRIKKGMIKDAELIKKYYPECKRLERDIFKMMKKYPRKQY